MYTVKCTRNAIQNNETVNASVKEGETFTIPKGYHNCSGTVTGVQGGGGYELQTKEVTSMKTELQLYREWLWEEGAKEDRIR